MLYTTLQSLSLGVVLWSSTSLGRGVIIGTTSSASNTSIAGLPTASVLSTFETTTTLESSSLDSSSSFSFSSIAFAVGPGLSTSLSPTSISTIDNSDVSFSSPTSTSVIAASGSRGFSVASSSTYSSSSSSSTIVSSSSDSIFTYSSMAIIVGPGLLMSTLTSTATGGRGFSVSSTSSSSTAPGRGFATSTSSAPTIGSTSLASDAAFSVSTSSPISMTSIINFLPTSVVLSTTSSTGTSISSTLSPLGINGGGGLTSVLSDSTSTSLSNSSSAVTTSDESLFISTLAIYGNSGSGKARSTSSVKAATPDTGRGFSYSTLSPTSSVVSSTSSSSGDSTSTSLEALTHTAVSGMTVTGNHPISLSLGMGGGGDVASTVTGNSNPPDTDIAIPTSPPVLVSILTISTCTTFTDEVDCDIDYVTVTPTASTLTATFTPLSSTTCFASNGSCGDAPYSQTSTGLYSNTTSSTVPYSTTTYSTVAYFNITSTPVITATSYFGHGTATDTLTPCIAQYATDPAIVWSLLPNTTTITITITANSSVLHGNSSSAATTTVSAWSPPPLCSTVSISVIGITAPITTSTVIITSKTGPTTYTTVGTPDYGGGKPDVKSTVSSSGIAWAPISTTSTTAGPKSPALTSVVTTPIVLPAISTPSSPLEPTTVNLGGVTVVVNPSQVIIGSTTVQNAGSTTVLTVSGQTFTVNPSQVLASGSVVAIPTSTTVAGIPVAVGANQVVIGTQTVNVPSLGSTTTITASGQTFTVSPSQVVGSDIIISIPTNSPASGAGIFVPVLTQTVVSGVTIQIGPTAAVIAGTTFSIGAGAPTTLIIDSGQAISIGSNGLGFASTTITPPVAAPSAINMVILDGDVVYVYGTTMAVIGDETYTYSAGSAPETEVFNGETITVGPSGVMFGQSTINGSANPTGLQIGIVGGISITEIGSSVAIIDGTAFTIGPGQAESTVIIDGKTITAGSSGLVIGGATLTFPFIEPTEVITAGGITFSEIGSSLVVIGGSTFTVGPDAKPTTEVFGGQTISIGPSGVIFKTTTVLITSMVTPSPTAAKAGATGATKSEAQGLGSALGVWGMGICMVLGVWVWL